MYIFVCFDISVKISYLPVYLSNLSIYLFRSILMMRSCKQIFYTEGCRQKKIGGGVV